jgi:hypothetical protein
LQAGSPEFKAPVPLKNPQNTKQPSPTKEKNPPLTQKKQGQENDWSHFEGTSLPQHEFEECL